MPMTLAAAGQIVRALGLTLIKVNGEYIVKPRGSTVDDPRCYFTDDLADAVGTAHFMHQEMQRSN